MSLDVLVPPAVEPVSTAEAAAYLRLGEPEDADALALLIASAREQVERLTGRALVIRTLRETRDDFDAPWRRSAGGAGFALPSPPLRSVERIALIDAAGTSADWPAEEWRTDAASDPGRILAVQGRFPRPGARAGGVRIDFTAGYGPAPEDVPAPLREAVLRLVAAAYADGASAEEALRGAVPRGVAALLRPFARLRP